MLTLTPSARSRVLQFMEDFGGASALRLTLDDESSPLAPRFELELVDPDDRDPGDVVLNADGLPVLVASASVVRLDRGTIDFDGGAFQLTLGADDAAASGDLAERVRAVLEARVNPSVAAHGGRIALVGVQDDVAYVRMTGGCQGCGLAAVTLRQGVERMLRQAVPELAGVRDVTDHAGGANPFYAKS